MPEPDEVSVQLLGKPIVNKPMSEKLQPSGQESMSEQPKPPAKPPKSVKPPSPVAMLQPYLSRRKAALTGAIGAAVIATLLGLVPYWIVYQICIGLLDGGALADGGQLIQLALLALLAVVCKGLLTALSVDWTHKVAYNVVYEVRMALADKLAKLPLGFFDRNDSGKIKHTMNEDVEKLEEGIAHLLPDISTSIALPVLSFTIMFALDWRMGLSVLAFMLLAIAGYSIVLTYLKPIQAGFVKAGAAVGSAILTYVYGMKVIRAFSRTDEAFESFARAVREFSEVSSQIEKKSVPAKTTAMLLSRTALLIVVPAGIWLVARGEMTGAELIFFVLMTLGVGAALFKVLRSGATTAFHLASALRSVNRLMEEPELPQSECAAEPADTTIRFAGVAFAYNKEQVLRDVNLEIPAGKMTALVGPSGAGKTTIARLLPRFWDVGEGAVTIGGVDVRDMSEERLQSLISFVFQDAYLFRGTVMDNIRLGKPDASDDEVIAAARRAGCHEFIERLPDGYHTEVGEGGSGLSVGQRQRISLVRAVLKDAPIIVLDEATSLVDPENEARIQDAISALLRSSGGEPKTIVAIAHRLGTIVHSDQIAVIDEGRVAAAGTHEQLLRECELYKTLWEAYEAGADEAEWAGEAAASGDAEVAGDAGVAAVVAHVSEPRKDMEHARAEARREASTAGAEGPERTVKAAISAAAAASVAVSDDPHRNLNRMSHLKQSLLLAGERSRTLWSAYLFTAFENVFAALGSIAIAAALYFLLAGEPGAAWRAAAWMGAMFAGQAVFYVLATKWLFPLYGHFLTHMRLYLGDRLRRLPYGFFLQHDASKLESPIKSDAGTYIYMPAIVVGLIKGFTIPTITFAAMLWIDWRLALASLVSVPLSLAVTALSERKLKHIVDRLSAARQAVNGRILEYIRGIAVIRSFGLTASRLKSYEEVIRKYRDASVGINRGLTPYTAVYNIAFELGFTLVLLVGGRLVANGALAPEMFMVYLVLAICFYDPLPLMDYAVYRRMLVMNINHMNDIIQADDLPVPPAELREKPNGHAVEFRGVTFGYDAAAPVLKDLDLVIPERSTTAVVGPSGAGKTTMLNLIARFRDVQQGAVLIGGADVRRMSSDELMSHLAFVFQDVYLFNDTIAENIRYGNPDATMEQVIDAAKKARCHEFIMKLPGGYDTVVGEGGGLLSGGQKQRISIARAILKDAPIILLDEATASVDPDNEQHIHEAFAELARDKTVIIIAHRLHTIRRADLIAVIDDGRIVQKGTHRELLRNPGIYRRFWEERRRAQGWRLDRKAAPPAEAPDSVS